MSQPIPLLTCLQLLGLTDFAYGIYLSATVHGDPIAIALAVFGIMSILDAILNFLGALVLIVDDDVCHKIVVIFTTISEWSTLKFVTVIVGFWAGISSFHNEDFTTTEQKVSGALALCINILQVYKHVASS